MTSPIVTCTAEYESILAEVLRVWAENVRLHQPEAVAAAFTEDAVFQGSDPTHAVGRVGVAAYYGKRPIGLDPKYRVKEVRGLGRDAFVAFVDVDFKHPDGYVDPTHLTLVLVWSDGWFIKQYHVSKIQLAPSA